VVAEYHNNARRDGLYLQPKLTRAAVATLHLDASFRPAFDGNVYAQPLYMANGPAGRGTFFVATENDEVIALDETSGATVWSRVLGKPAGRTGAGCGNISPLGITGTPYIDPVGRTIYLDAVSGTDTSIVQHLVHAMSIDDGSERPGWPLDVGQVKTTSASFNPVYQNQRGALTVLGGTLYVPFGGHAGDCGPYHGWVVAIPLQNPSSATAWVTSARAGGVWTPGGVASDGSGIFAVSGNTAGTTTWAGGEAVLRLGAGATFSGQPQDFFVPSNWQDLDARDSDLGGACPLLLDAPGSTPSALAMAFGKSGIAYLLDRNNLGGFGHGNGETGEGLFSARVANGAIISAAAGFTSPAAGTFAVFGGPRGASCPGSQGSLVALKIAGSPPQFETAWCADNGGTSSPIVTTPDGTSDFIVWSVGAEGTNRLRGWDGVTGAPIFSGGGASELMADLRHFTTLIAVNGRLIVAADRTVYAFTP
jgi:hypothetical protein